MFGSISTRPTQTRPALARCIPIKQRQRKMETILGLPYFPLYVSDYEADTAHLTLEEDGTYLRLLRLCWRTPGCSIPAEPKWIARQMRVSWEDFERIVAPILSEFFSIKDGRYYSPRLAIEAEKVAVANSKRKMAGSKGGIARALKYKENISSNAIAMLKQPEPEPEPDIREAKASLCASEEIHDFFEDFWDQYPHRGGAKKGKAAARKSWDRAIKSKANPSQIIQGAMRYATDAQVLRGYAKDPATWLNQQCWEDDVEREQRPSFGAGSGSSGGMVAAFAAVAARRTSH